MTVQLDLLPDYRKVYFVDARGWHSYRASDLSGIRTVGRDFPCPQNCPYDTTCHFMITDDGTSFTKLCTLDVLKRRPFHFNPRILGIRKNGRR